MNKKESRKKGKEGEGRIRIKSESSAAQWESSESGRKRDLRFERV